ncbi:MAG TPA: VWA domain-containing protein, partial [Pyrinomonadaceae bacterium]|nr:VWA domain-containing protein [Pyrinomonadaceae bacterium]
CTCILMLIFVISVAAQDEIEKIETDLASFEVTVSDKNGNPVRNLTQDDFRVFENGVERPIDFFQPIKKQDEGRPLSVVFALDVSGSMTPAEIERLRQAMQNFIRRLADYNSYFAVMTFAMEVKTVQQFTNRPEVLEKSFDRLNRNQNGLSTHAYDAVDDAVRLIARKSPKTIKDRIPKRAVIVITDGFPVGDSVSPSTVIERANNAEASVFSVILPSYSRLQPDKRPVLTPLEASGLIDRTGGKSLYATDKNFEPLFASLAEEITSSYAIAFYPPENVRDAKPREVRIESKSGLIVRQNRRTYLLKK